MKLWINEAFDFNQVKTDDAGRNLTRHLVNPHNGRIGDILYMKEDKSFQLFNGKWPCAFCVIEASEAPDGKARYMSLHNCFNIPIQNDNKKVNPQVGVRFGGSTKMFDLDFYVNYTNPHDWQGYDRTQYIWNQREHVRSLNFDAANYCYTYNPDVSIEYRIKTDNKPLGFYCPAYDELLTGIRNILKHKIYSNKDNNELFDEIEYIFNNMSIYAIWTSSVFQLGAAFAYNLRQMKMEGYKSNVGMTNPYVFLAMPFIRF